MVKIPFTPEGYERLCNELAQLKKVERPAAIKAIEEARAHGDLSENAEYDAAKDRQGFVEARINELEYKLASADVISADSITADKVTFGTHVVLENLDTGEEVEYYLVGPDECDVAEGKLSIASPLGKGLLGKVAGDEIGIQVPGGRRSYELIRIFI